MNFDKIKKQIKMTATKELIQPHWSQASGLVTELAHKNYLKPLTFLFGKFIIIRDLKKPSSYQEVNAFNDAP